MKLLMIMLATFGVEEELSWFASKKIVSTVFLLSDRRDIMSVNKLVNSSSNRSHIYVFNSDPIRAYFVKVLISTELLKVASDFIQTEGC